jgi:demethylmenaquinone methyltransferase/2-methoxy-6-polyprenyl-1,4-benzoquinol methylase
MIEDYDRTKKYELLDRVGFKKFFKAEKWADYNRQFFDGLASKYDLVCEFLSFGRHSHFKEQAIRNVGIGPGAKVLDLCTGTGGIATLIARNVPSAQVTGVDVSEKMLEIARRRGAGLPNLKFEKADVLSLPFQDRTFDVVFTSFGLRNLDDMEKGILEMKRVTKSGGRITSLDLGKPKGVFLNFIYYIYFLHIVPFLGAVFFHHHEANSFYYLTESGKYFPRQEKLVEIFKSFELREVKNYDFMLGAVAQQVGIVP